MKHSIRTYGYVSIHFFWLKSLLVGVEWYSVDHFVMHCKCACMFPSLAGKRLAKS